MNLAGLFKIAGHLGQHLYIGNPHIDGETEGLEDVIADPGGGLLRGRVQMGDGCEIQIAFVDGDLLQVGCVIAQKLHHGPAVAAVHGMVGRLHHQIRAFPQGGCHRLGGLDAVFLRGNGLGQDDTVTALLVSADDGGNGAQIHRAAVF